MLKIPIDGGSHNWTLILVQIQLADKTVAVFLGFLHVRQIQQRAKPDNNVPLTTLPSVEVILAAELGVDCLW